MSRTKSTVLKVYGMNVKYFTFVEPANETVAVVSDDDVLQVWDVLTGRLVNTFRRRSVCRAFVDT